jgi:hypothetical protein
LHELEEGGGLVVRTFASIGEEVGNRAGEETPGPTGAQERFGDGAVEEDMLPGLDAFPAGAGDAFAEFVRFIFGEVRRSAEYAVEVFAYLPAAGKKLVRFGEKGAGSVWRPPVRWFAAKGYSDGMNV